MAPTGLEPVTSVILVQRPTNWVMKVGFLGAGCCLHTWFNLIENAMTCFEFCVTGKNGARKRKIHVRVAIGSVE